MGSDGESAEEEREERGVMFLYPDNEKTAASGNASGSGSFYVLQNQPYQLFFLVAQSLGLLYQDLLAVAGESICHKLFVRLRSDHGYDRDDHKADEHAERACVDGRLQHFGKRRTDQHVGKHEADREDEVHPAGESCRLPPVQAVQERSEECARHSAPGNTHQLRDESHVGLVLDQRDDDGDQDEEHDQPAHDQELLLLLEFLENVSADQIQRDG